MLKINIKNIEMQDSINNINVYNIKNNILKNGYNEDYPIILAKKLLENKYIILDRNNRFKALKELNLIDKANYILVNYNALLYINPNFCTKWSIDKRRI